MDWGGWVKAFFGQFQLSITGKIVRPAWPILLLAGALVTASPTVGFRICGGAYVAVALVMAVRGTREKYGLPVDHRDGIAVAEGLLMLAAHVQLTVGGALSHDRNHVALGLLLTVFTAFFLFIFFVLRWDERARRGKKR